MSNQKKSQEEMLATMRSRLSNAMGAYSSSRENELEDLKFLPETRIINTNGPKMCCQHAVRCKGRH